MRPGLWDCGASRCQPEGCRVLGAVRLGVLHGHQMGHGFHVEQSTGSWYPENQLGRSRVGSWPLWSSWTSTGCLPLLVPGTQVGEQRPTLLRARMITLGQQ